MITRLTITLKQEEKSALRALAEQEYREPWAQAALIIRSELARRGLLQVQPAQNPTTRLPGREAAIGDITS